MAVPLPPVSLEAVHVSDAVGVARSATGPRVAAARVATATAVVAPPEPDHKPLD